jgi:hypothetical protein
VAGNAPFYGAARFSRHAEVGYLRYRKRIRDRNKRARNRLDRRGMHGL